MLAGALRRRAPIILRPKALIQPPAYSCHRSQSTHPVALPELRNPAQRNHHDLPSFLAYAARTSLSPKSTTYVGTYYEYIVQAALRRLGFSLNRVGGRGDYGIDLVGTWHLPESLTRRPFRVIVQCKRLKNRLGPHLVRELEGAFAGAPTGWHGRNIFGLLVSPREATKGVRDAMANSKFPMVWLLVESDFAGMQTKAEEDGRIRQVLWNQAATEAGLQGLDVTLRYQSKSLKETEPLEKECILLWQGSPVPGLNVSDSYEAENSEGQLHDSMATG